MAKTSFKESIELIRIGQRIKRFRDQSKLALAELSRLSGVPANTYLVLNIVEKIRLILGFMPYPKGLACLFLL